LSIQLLWAVETSAHTGLRNRALFATLAYKFKLNPKHLR
jgi:hypothetical protein